MNTYTTIEGQTLDEISFEVFGSSDFVEDLIKANIGLSSIFEVVIPEGTELVIPRVEKQSEKKISIWD